MGVYLKGVNKEWADRVLTVAGYRQFFKDDEIVEVKEPHGRLIDADEEYKGLSEMKVEGEMFTTAVEFSKRIVQDAPTVIEAEGEDVSD